MNNMFLLASYPKSGNTWLRILLSNLLFPEKAPVSINDILVGEFKYNKHMSFDQLMPWEASDLNCEATDCFLPDFYRLALDNETDTVFLKTHDMLRKNQDGQYIFPPERVQGVIHIVRHPLDVLPSYSKHFGMTHEEGLTAMLTPDLTTKNQHKLAKDKRRLPENHGSWNAHTLSWMDESIPYPVYRVRYEDLRKDPLTAFDALFSAMGMSFAKEQLQLAIEQSSFSNLQKQEQTTGFRERLDKSTAPFFRKGIVGSGKTEIAPELQHQLIAGCLPVMAQLGYE
jgi:Sulfotransferase domain.